MKPSLIFLLIVVIALFAVGCTGSKGSASTASDGSSDAASDGAAEAVYHKLTPEQAYERLQSGDPVTLVDVRTQEEFDEAHIEGAVVIPNETIADKQPQQLPDLDAEILVYCRSGRRSKEAANKLVALGYTAVYDFGGIIDWPYDTVS